MFQTLVIGISSDIFYVLSYFLNQQLLIQVNTRRFKVKSGIVSN